MILGAVWTARLGESVGRIEYALATVTWIAFATLLVARQIYGWRGRRAAILTLEGFACALAVLLVYSDPAGHGVAVSELFVVGVSWHTAPVAVREKLAFREDELADVLRGLVGELPVARGAARVDVQPRRALRRREARHRAERGRRSGVSRTPALDRARRRRRRAVRAPRAGRHPPCVSRRVVARSPRRRRGADLRASSRPRSRSQARPARRVRCCRGPRARVRRGQARAHARPTIARGAANVSSVAVELARVVFGELAGKRVLVVGAGKMCALAAQHLYAHGAAENRRHQPVARPRRACSPTRSTARRAPWEDLEKLLVAADVVISSTGAREPVLTPRDVQASDEGAAVEVDDRDRHRGAARRRARDRASSTACTCTTSTISTRS